MNGKENQLHHFFRKRRSGILLHPTSLPAAVTDGALGDDAYRFIRFLTQGGFTVWQMLPVNSIGSSYASPYQGTSVHAGNPWLISTEKLLNERWFEGNFRESGDVQKLSKCSLIALSRIQFDLNATPEEKQVYIEFKNHHSYWLEDYALYSALKVHHEQQPWWLWHEPLRRHDASALESFKNSNLPLIEDFSFEQFIFYGQWKKLKSYANDNGILLFGDLPILVAHDSVDVWLNSDNFLLDDKGQPVKVAGVPPDYFSPVGQRWGNPLYNWQELARDGFQWWVNRLRTQLSLFDIVRLDHFRGFLSLWEIPAQCQTAVEGHWQSVPGRELLEVLKKEFGDLPIVAEDLGTISQEVLDLRDDFNLPGMKVLLFAFESDASNPYLPHNHDHLSVVYTGTHDNNTTLGWYETLDDARREQVIEYLQHPVDNMPWPLIRTALVSVCPMAILPMQDLLGLDGTHRMNTPGTTTGNWLWRFEWEWITPGLEGKLRGMNEMYARI